MVIKKEMGKGLCNKTMKIVPAELAQKVKLVGWPTWGLSASPHQAHGNPMETLAHIYVQEGVSPYLYVIPNMRPQDTPKMRKLYIKSTFSVSVAPLDTLRIFY